MLGLGKKVLLETFQLWLVVIFLIKFSFFSKSGTIRNTNTRICNLISSPHITRSLAVVTKKWKNISRKSLVWNEQTQSADSR